MNDELERSDVDIVVDEGEVGGDKDNSNEFAEDSTSVQDNEDAYVPSEDDQVEGGDNDYNEGADEHNFSGGDDSIGRNDDDLAAGGEDEIMDADDDGNEGKPADVDSEPGEMEGTCFAKSSVLMQE